MLNVPSQYLSREDSINGSHIEIIKLNVIVMISPKDSAVVAVLIKNVAIINRVTVIGDVAHWIIGNAVLELTFVVQMVILYAAMDSVVNLVTFVAVVPAH